MQPGAYGSPLGGGCGADRPSTSSITWMFSELPMITSPSEFV
jgi:hypothetical protein